MSNWIGLLDERDGMLTAGWIGRDWVDQRSTTPGTTTGWTTSRHGWCLRKGDQFYSADIDGDDRDELIVVAPTGEWIGVLREDGGGLAATWIKNDWVNEPGIPGATGWDLRRGDRYYVADIDGDDRDELIVVAPTGEWIGVLREDGGGLAATWIKDDWVNEPGGAGANGWNLQRGDRYCVADIDGDDRDELVVVSPNGEWIGVLREDGGGLAATWIKDDWVNEPGGAGANGWNLQRGDRYYVADIDGDDRDELVVVGPNGEWIGVLREDGGGLAATWIKDDWVNEPGGAGANGWNLQRGDRYYVADIDGDDRDELVVVGPNGEWIGVLREDGGGLAATWIKDDWVNEPGGAGANGWNLQRGDRYYVADIDGDDRDELVVVGPNGEWIGVLREDGGELAAGFIAYDWVNHPGGSGANGWDLKMGDRYIAADTSGTGRCQLVVSYLRASNCTTGSSPMDSEILAIHAAMLFTGEILYFGGDEHNPAQAGNPQDFNRTRIYDVRSRTVTQIGSPMTDIFCSGHAFLPDGRLLVGGGTEEWPSVQGHGHALGFAGHDECWVYDPQARTWTQVANMNPNPNTLRPSGRWYPTLITLHTGEVLAVFGHPSASDTARHRNNTPERYTATGNTWNILPPVPGSDAIDYTQIMLNYPRLHLLPNRNIFFSTPVNGNHIYNPFAGNFVGNAIPETGDVLYDRSWDATSVLLPLLPGDNYNPRVLVCGSTTPMVINLDLQQPRWRPTAPRNGGAAGRIRQNLCAALLPTGEVFVTGGVGASGQDIDAVLEAEIFSPGVDWNADTYTWDANDPNTGTQSWITAETASVPRNYHSVALLMPDGRIWTAGSSKNAASGDPNDPKIAEKRIEIYSPWYCGEPVRPQIVYSPGGIDYGQAVEIRTPQAADIQRVALIRAGSVTHAFDSDQRYVGLSFQHIGGDTLSVDGPPDPGIAPPGYYMLWIVDDVGRPCTFAEFVRVPGVVQVTNILFSPPGPDLASERVAIENQTAVDVDMTDWTLEDLANHVFRFPPFQLAAGAHVQVWTKGGVNDASNLYWGSGAPIWNNLGDTAILRNDQGQEVSRYSFR